MKRILRTTAAVIICTAALLQAELPHVLRDTPREIVTAEQKAQFAPNTFLENILIGRKNRFYFSSFLDGTIYTQDLGKNPTPFAHIEGNPAGLAFTPQGDLIAVGNDRNQKGTVFHISRRGEVTRTVQIEGASHFLNGITPVNDTTVLIADSHRGVIWRYNPETFTATLWLEHDLLETPLPETAATRIGVNGLEIFRDTLYAVNTQAMKIIAIPLEENRAGEPRIYAENILGDDLTFDTEGNLYLATHPYNSVVKITPTGDRVIIADQFDGVTGCTALKFGFGEQKNQLYVVTNGGIFMPPAGGVRPAKVVMLNLREPI